MRASQVKRGKERIMPLLERSLIWLNSDVSPFLLKLHFGLRNRCTRDNTARRRGTPVVDIVHPMSYLHIVLEVNIKRDCWARRYTNRCKKTVPVRTFEVQCSELPGRLGDTHLETIRAC